MRERLDTLVHRWRLMRRASAVHRLRRLRERALASLEPVRSRRFEWAECDSVSSNGTEIRQRVRMTPIQSERAARFEWVPRRELAIRGWE